MYDPNNLDYVIKSTLKNKKKLMLLLDYDGTLTSIVDKPELAILSKKTKDCLIQLSHKYITCIVSGRELNDLKKQINLNTVYYSGNHGFEFEGPPHNPLKYEIAKEYIQEIQQIYIQLKNKLHTIKDCIIENKKFSLSIHYRLVKCNDEKLIACIIDKQLQIFSKLKLHHGKKVFEIRPNFPWNKGIAITHFFNIMNLSVHEYCPIYIGDDVTDEDAFNAVNEVGISIKVSEDKKQTNAKFFLRNPHEVQSFLESLIYI